MNIEDLYVPFFPCYVEALEDKLDSFGLKIKHGHAQQLIAAYFGFKSYAAFQSSTLSTGYKPTTYTPNHTNYLFDRITKLENKLEFTVTTELSQAIYDCLSELHKYESSKLGGAFLRALRQMKASCYPNTRIFVGSVFLDITDIKVFGDISSDNSFECFLLYPLPMPETFYILEGIKELEKPNTQKLIEAGFKPSIILGDVLANIIEFHSPGLVDKFIKFKAA